MAVISRPSLKRKKVAVPQADCGQRMEKLDSLEFDWDPLCDTWWRNWEQLRTFGKNNGHYNITSSTTGTQLACWVYHLRHACRAYKLEMECDAQPVKVNALTRERIKALKEIGSWDQA
jgi:hypothetical protein